MGRDPGSRDPRDRDVDPESSRQEIAEGAREIEVDGWVDAHLKERPRTVSAMKAIRPLRETARGVGVSNAPTAPPPPLMEAPDTQRDPLDSKVASTPKWSPSTVAFVAQKDQRISELEEELAKAKQQLAAVTPTPVVPRPAMPMKTVPMRALSPQPMPAFAAPPAPPLAPRGQGATLFMPATDAPLASPYPSAPPTASSAPTAPPAAPYPSAPPAATYPSAPPAAPYPSAPPAIAVHSTAPPPELVDYDEGGGRTMMLTPERALLGGAVGGAPLEPVAPVGLAPASQAPPELGAPAPFANTAHEPTAKTFEQGDLVLAPPKKSKAGWLVVPAVLACALAGGAYAYRMGLGPFAELRKTATASDDARSTKANGHGAETPTSEATPAATSKSAPTGAAATAEPSASAAASGAASTPVPAPDDPAELAALLSFQGYLTVESTKDAEVVVQGQSAGRTNTRLLVRCGPRNVRLRGSDQAWLSDGEHVQIECMKHTHVAIESK